MHSSDQKLIEVIPGKSLRLSIRGLGPVPSLKNSKRAILDSRTGQMRTLTDRRVKKWMESAIQSIASQLHYALGRIDTRIWTTPHPRSLMLSLLPEDDSRQHISELIVRYEQVEKGEEGADILIELI